MERYPDVPSYQYSAAESHNDLAFLFVRCNQMDQARTALEQGEGIAETLVRNHPEVVDHHIIRIKLRLTRRLLAGRNEDSLRVLGEAEQLEREAEALPRPGRMPRPPGPIARNAGRILPPDEQLRRGGTG